jgi:hypothetical protein
LGKIISREASPTLLSQYAWYLGVAILGQVGKGERDAEDFTGTGIGG